jgi:hypothetical protein
MATPNVSTGYILKLWDFASLLLYRAENTEGPERELLVEQADEVLANIEHHLGRAPLDQFDVGALLSSNS